MCERTYYLASGADALTVRAYFDGVKTAFEHAESIAKEFGGKAVFWSSAMAGVAFDGDPPAGWSERGKMTDGTRWFRPLKRSKAGKAAASKIDAVRIPQSRDFHATMTDEEPPVVRVRATGSVVRAYIAPEIIGDHCIISVPAVMDFEPPESKRLKMSEYWQIREAAEETA